MIVFDNYRYLCAETEQDMLKIMAAIVKAKVCLIQSAVFTHPLNRKCHHVTILQSCNNCCTILLATQCQYLHYANQAGLKMFEKLEKRAWYPLFVYALNLPTFQEFLVICAVMLVCVYCRTFICTLLTVAVCALDSDYAVLYAFLQLLGKEKALKLVKKEIWLHMSFGKLQFMLRSYVLSL